MTPTNFPESNSKFGPPPDLAESQCSTIPAYIGEIKQGSVDGVTIVVVAWQPSDLDLETLNKGCPIFLTVIGGLPPHFLTTNFKTATTPC